MFVFEICSCRIIITAGTTDLPVSVNVTCHNDKATSVENNVLQSSTVILPENSEFSKKSVEFTATGTQEARRKSYWHYENYSHKRKSLSTPITGSVGTGFSSGNLTFVSTQSATIKGVDLRKDIGPGGVTFRQKTIQ